MSAQSKLVGYIEEAWPGRATSNQTLAVELIAAEQQICRHNENVLGALPEVDEWPPLCRPMFAWTPVRTPMIVYKNRLIHFAASLKEMDWELRDWLDKFETLLRNLYWESAYIRFEAACIGIHEFTYRPTDGWVQELCLGRVTPIADWSFSSTLPAEDLAKLRE